MRSIRRIAVLLITVGCFAANAQAADPVRGKALYENHCIGCHDETVHKREQHKARSVAEIQKYVVRWAKEMTLTWSANDHGDVAEFLNQTYYKY